MNNPLLSKSQNLRKRPSLLPNLVGRSTASTRPIHIYMGIVVLLLHF